MKLSKDTLEILKNFASINNNLTIHKGNVLQTVNESRTTFATATIAENFPLDFGVYNLPNFLSTIGIFENPELEFSDSNGELFVNIVDSNEPTIRTKYYSAGLNILTKIATPKKLPECRASFVISAVNLARIERASGTLGCKDLMLSGDNGKITATVCDLTRANKNTFTVTLSENYNGESFSVCIDQSRMKMVTGDYTCNILGDLVLQCVNTQKPITYIYAVFAQKR